MEAKGGGGERQKVVMGGTERKCFDQRQRGGERANRQTYMETCCPHTCCSIDKQH